MVTWTEYKSGCQNESEGAALLAALFKPKRGK